MAETIEYLKNNMEITELLGSMGMNALKGLLTTIPIIGAFLAAGRYFPGLDLMQQIIVALFVTISTIAMILLIRGWIGSEWREWVHSKEITFEQMTVAAVVSWVAAFIATGLVLILRDLLLALLYLTPLSVLPCLAFLYMLRFRYEVLWQRVAVSIGYGYGFGAGLKVLGILLVLLVDLIGWQLTALGVVLEILISAFYLYIDLTEWVRQDVERKMSAEEWEDRRQELEQMKEIADRLAWK